MRTPVPTVPSQLPDVEVASAPRRGVPLVVAAQPGERSADGAGRASLGPGADRLPAQLPIADEVTGKTGETYPVPGTRHWVVGVGAGEPADWRAAAAALVRAFDARAEADQRAGRSAARAAQVLLPAGLTADQVTGLVLGAMLGDYRYAVTGKARPPRLRTLHLVTGDGTDPAQVDTAVRQAASWARATGLARDLANTPSNVKDPDWLASTGAEVAGRTAGLAVTVRDETWLAEQGFGGVLAVGGGSARPPRLLELTWRPRGSAKAPHLVLVGKGITFDTGGISIKPADGMHLMRTDMSGGAAVIAALRAVAELRLPVRVTGLVPCAENHVSGSAFRPGDVVRHYGGQTTEVTNTDAEGRMVLADALAYATRQLKADVLVDVATLTGAMKVGLGLRTGGLFASSDELAGRVAAAGAAVGERWWRMPLLDEHAEAVRSEIADLRQCPPGPGGITAALFLREFTAGLPWAHLDIAGPARAEQPYDEVTPGATGFAARTLVELVASYAR
ncbi:leucyl aminopeptidase [Goodfellowiella coeruleoviolacea]|uniref:Probable cytosol aminopeptidase n=1 Tax=Goodfellowiella coeruleoviolacea TaxID=334858 RepID=A0AAE3GDZ9_9PSEU|nr:leucyl aminopeptidase [Goodfellowiella coeruleoviolacea]MCP2165600.1 leucyl aminopeptidase [Goodfellowiella coeruleoviolacea]